MTATEIERLIRWEIFQKEISVAQLAKKAGVGVNTLYHFQRTKNIRIDTLLLLCGALGMEITIGKKNEKNT